MKGGMVSSGDFISFWYSCAAPADKRAGVSACKHARYPRVYTQDTKNMREDGAV